MPFRGRLGPTFIERARVVTLLGTTQILAWGSTYYLPAVLAEPITRETNWSNSVIYGGLSWSLLVSGIVAPRVGRVIDLHGGRVVLGGSSLLLAAGLAVLGSAGSLATYFVAWTILGLGMATGLYDAGFATLGRLFGAKARPSITGLTLFGGFASTVGWPVVHAFDLWLGWRGACYLLAGLHLAVGASIHLFLLPAPPARAEPPPRDSTEPSLERAPPDRRFLMLVIAFTLFACVAAGVSVNFLDLVRRLGVAPAAAIGIGMIIGPSQVGGRIVEFTFGRGMHPIWTARSGMLLFLAGLSMLMLVGPVGTIVAVIFYGAGNGIMTIARGTLPLALFGAQGYGARLGRLARPAVVAQALAPVAFAGLLEREGPTVALSVTLALAAIAFAAFGFLRREAPAA